MGISNARPKHGALLALSADDQLFLKKRTIQGIQAKRIHWKKVTKAKSCCRRAPSLAGIMSCEPLSLPLSWQY
jgi:hypothetical protein